jgi:Sel1 repeat
MAAKTFQDIVRLYSQEVKLDETATPELWAAKLLEELAAKQAKLQETSPQNLLRFALEKQCLELEEAVQVLNEEIQRTAQQQAGEKTRQAEEDLAAKPQRMEKIRRLKDELAEKRSKLQETDPQHLLHFVLQKQCVELEEAVQFLELEVRRMPQRHLLEVLRQAVQDGDKNLYDCLINGETRSLLPAEDEVEYRSLLEIKRFAAVKRWPRDTSPTPSNQAATDQLPPTPAPAPPPPRPNFDSPKSNVAMRPLPETAAIPSPPAPSEAPELVPVKTQPESPKRPRVNPWVWIVPTAAIIIVVVLVLALRHYDETKPAVGDPVSRTTEGSRSSLGVPLAGPITIDGLMLLFNQAHQATNSVDRIRFCREFMRQSAEYATTHPEQTDLWMRRAAAAMVLDYADDGWVAGQKLMAAGRNHELDTQAQKVTTALEHKGWLEPKVPKRDWSRWSTERLKAAAEDGDEEAQVALGDCYFRGFLGFGQDYNESAAWYGKAAEQGNFEAQNYLGTIYLNGLTGETNYIKALGWFRRAADQGSAVALGNLGIMYEHGWGVETNIAEAVSWYGKSVALGNTNAVQSLKKLTQSGQDSAR